ncbi:hypothetical protein QFC19_004535 [Naganishia cerealis]|uniref:Uncharacterized protein n=1 Tax=Naganishia cerealis TaxID=610337 RepID=A0ACC2VV12_9TREE|nr:hypothetical protein QFC19_004535 [Naganishia cerealis]
MLSTRTAPQGSPTPEIAERFQSVLHGKLAAALRSPTDSVDPPILECLDIALKSRARQSLDTLGNLTYDPHQLLPLRVAEKLAGRTDLPPTVVLDMILAYPTYLSAIHRVVGICISRQENLIPTFRTIFGLLFRTLGAENRKVSPPTKQHPRTEDAISRGRQPLSRTVYTLLLIARAHHDLATAMLNYRSALELLATSYSHVEANEALSEVTKIYIKSTILLLLHTLLSTLQQTEREWKLVNMQDEEREAKGRTLRDADLVDDYRFFFDAKGENESGSVGQRSKLGEVEIDILRSLATGDVNPTERGHADEARIEPIKALFPTIPSYLLIQALSHPQFDKPISKDGSDPGVEALTNALLDNSLPSALDKLRRAVRGEDEQAGAPVPDDIQLQTTASIRPPRSASPANAASTPPVQPATKKPYKRENIWNDMPMDFGKLRVGNVADEASLEAALSNIPSQLRDSILRLSEQQKEEEEAERLAERDERDARRSRAEAARSSAGQGTNGRKNVQKSRIVAFEEELGEDDDDDLQERIRMRGLNGDSEGSDEGEVVTNDFHDGSDSEVVENLDEEPDESWIEQLYIQNRAAFNRDSATRRSQQRAEMKRVTGILRVLLRGGQRRLTRATSFTVGWPDDRLEDWASLLDRNVSAIIFSIIGSQVSFLIGIPNSRDGNKS